MNRRRQHGGGDDTHLPSGYLHNPAKLPPRRGRIFTIEHLIPSDIRLLWMNYILAILFGATVSLSFYFPVDKPNSVYGKDFETSSPQLNIKIASIEIFFFPAKHFSRFQILRSNISYPQIILLKQSYCLWNRCNYVCLFPIVSNYSIPQWSTRKIRSKTMADTACPHLDIN